NADAPAAMARECAKLGSLLVHYSTDYVFDGTSRSPYDEADATNPTSAYGRSKLAGEEAVRTSGCRHLILRTSWVYAAHGKNFLLTMLRLARERPELCVVADQVGSPTAASSLAETTLNMVRAAEQRSGTWNVTNQGQTSWHGFAERIVEQGAALDLCRRVPVRAIKSADYPTPAQRPAFSVLDNTRLARDFGLRLPAWEVALDATLAHLRQAQAA
ncbi:MAG TPA: dTDP-4-dehydrorhamnose reductase, partial [Verrucomicrobiae bacterium]|nr:dTDP-4-dehydrorhamnose reductase [Verrucomicrobiae bacterium]